MATKRSSGKGPTTWHDLAAETDDKKRQWLHGHQNVTEYVPCGIDWDAVAVKPMPLGLDALDAMRIGVRRGYLIVADHVRGELYVMVPTGHGEAFAGIPCVRLLGRGHQVLVPRSPLDRSVAADWVGTPHDLDTPVLVDADRLAARLRDLAPAYAEAMAS
ncbi:hypothetical protein [Streptomyces geranii]|uniref:hypothetical protein n=1 Tax=Streptomyces geranii TaxID=2058923 RepID=UPI000D03D938|nr:hypothetical protein [Streptomyces geranii]